ncbi:MAG: hypothetical protein HQ494_12645 [Rhodospirillales bacterium]|nr:hypothetical protein [Rhodospirillales bacterium]
MRQLPFGFVRRCLGTGILIVALGFQMLPFFLLLVVAVHTLGVSSGRLLVFIPGLFLVMAVAFCWLASKRTQHAPARPPSKARRTENKPARGQVVLIKTRDERYQDLRDALSQAWR